jgi:hypothetical protein
LEIIFLENTNTMSQNPFAQLSTEELNKKAQTLKKANIVLSVFLIIMALAAVANTVLGGFSVFSVLPICFLPMVLVNFGNLKKIQTELATRSTPN